MNRTSINPWQWSKQFGFNQGVLVENPQKTLYISGQTSVDVNGNPIHKEDMRKQMQTALDNLETVLKDAEMNLSHIVRLNITSTNVEQTLANYDLYGAYFAKNNTNFTMRLVEVTRLAHIESLIELDAVASI